MDTTQALLAELFNSTLLGSSGDSGQEETGAAGQTGQTLTSVLGSLANLMQQVRSQMLKKERATLQEPHRQVRYAGP